MKTRPEIIATKTPKGANDGAMAPAWLSVSDAAARAGVSKRAMQKRAAAGKIGARKIGIGAAARWEINGRELDGNQAANQTANQTANREPKGRERFAPLGTVERESANQVRTANREPDANREPTGRALAPEREAELKAEIAFLRGIVESDRRDMAEIRAALREALKLAPKQLTAGAASGADVGGVAVSNGATSTPDREPFKAPNPTTAKQAGAASPTYDEIADQIEHNLAARGL